VPQPPPATVATPTSIYLLDNLSALSALKSEVLSLPLSANGTVNATVFLTDSDISLSSIRADRAGHFYAFEYDGNYSDILEFGATSAGTFTPLRRIGNASFPSTTFGALESLAVDAAGDVAVAGSSTIDIFDPTANGVATPVRTIGGASTGLAATTSTLSMAFDSSGNLYAVESTSNTTSNILEFGSATTGNVAPSRVIPLSFLPGGVALDRTGNVYVTHTVETSITPSPVYQSSVIEFASGASGGTTPIGTLTPPNFNYSLGGLAFDSTGALYVFAVDAQNNGDVAKFSAGATGAVSPVSVIVTGPGSGSLDSSVVVVGP
jgi:hypothetical protein